MTKCHYCQSLQVYASMAVCLGWATSKLYGKLWFS